MNAQANLPQLQPRATGTQVVTGVVRLSYCHVFQPKAGPEGGEPKYSVSVLVPKSDTATIEALKAARKAAIDAKWPGKGADMVKREGFRKGLRDGDIDRPEDPAYKGMMFFNCSSKNKPQVVDRMRNPVTTPEGCRSGDYARVNVNAFGYQNKGLGVAFGLNNIQMIERGPPLAGGPDAVDVFDDVPGGSSPGAGGGADEIDDIL